MGSTTEDNILWKAFKSGDESAFSKIYRQYVKPLYQYGLKITADHSVIEDAIQDLFVDIWKSRQNLADPDSIKYYLFRILRRKIGRITAKSFATENLEDSDFNAIHPIEAFENEILRLEGDDIRQRKIHEAIRHLSLRQQEAINLRYFHDFTAHQIAEIMGISLQSVHNTLQKAMKSLRATLDQRWDLLLPFIGYLSFNNTLQILGSFPL